MACFRVQGLTAVECSISIVWTKSPSDINERRPSFVRRDPRIDTVLNKRIHSPATVSRCSVGVINGLQASSSDSKPIIASFLAAWSTLLSISKIYRKWNHKTTRFNNMPGQIRQRPLCGSLTNHWGKCKSTHEMVTYNISLPDLAWWFPLHTLTPKIPLFTSISSFSKWRLMLDLTSTSGPDTPTACTKA